MSPAFIPIGIIAILVALWFLRRAMRRTQLPKLRSSKLAVSPRNSNAVPVAPTTWLARWSIQYRSANGELTQRIVRVTSVHPRLERFKVWCELRGDDRTLNFFGIEAVADATTGQAVDLASWLKAYNESRRATNRQQHDAIPPSAN